MSRNKHDPYPDGLTIGELDKEKAMIPKKMDDPAVKRARANALIQQLYLEHEDLFDYSTTGYAGDTSFLCPKGADYVLYRKGEEPKKAEKKGRHGKA